MFKRKSLMVFLILFGLSFVFIGTGLELGKPISNNIENEAIMYMNSKTEDSLYLSDINYIANQSYAGWDKIRYDEIEKNGKISVRIENNVFTFEKGIWAHASSQVTYDISNYNYKYFTAFVGMNVTGGGNGVTYSIYTSTDGKNWGEAKFKEVKKPRDNATAVKIDIEGANYLRLCAKAIGGNGNAHSVYADAKLVNDVNEESNFMSVSDYNNIIKERFPNQTEITPELEVLLLKRELMKRMGTYTLNSIYNQSQENKDTLDWMLNNPSVLRHFIMGGQPENSSYLNAFNQLSRIYNANKADFSNRTVTKYGTELADLYTRMAIAMALTHDGSPFGLWIDSSPENLSDALNRYQIYKQMHKNGNFVVLRNEDGSPKLGANGAPQLDVTEWFEKYNVEEMRYIFNNQSDDEEVLWLNEYTQSFIDKYPNEYGKYLSPHPYMDYRTENLNQPEFYNPALKDAWDEDFHGIFSKYNISYRPAAAGRSSLKKIWMFLRNKQGVLTGAVCGGISKIGSTTRAVHGIPAVVIGQPGHAAILYYWQDANGKGYWNIDNDVSGWTASERGERLPLGWGNANSNYARGSHQVVYLALSQEALNDYDNLVKSEELLMLGDVNSSKTEQEKMYRKALETQSINFDAWLNLVNLYLGDDTKTEEDYYNLAHDIGENLKYYPLPMYQLTNLLKPKLTSVESSYKFTLLQTRILTEASVTPNNTADNYYVQQPSLTRLEANFLLGKLDSSIATFSFDGEDAGKIVLSSRFDGNGVRWDYAIKGKGANGVWDVGDFKEVSFSADEEHKLQLTKEEIASITSENDIYIHIVGVNYAEENIYKIDINESRGLPATLFASDLENKVLGAVDTIEWKYNEKDNWTTYKSKQPDLTGNKTVILRMGATGTYLASKENLTFTFTKDAVNNKRKYIPVEHLALEAVSSEATSASQQGNATNALDANYNTRWHSAWNGSDTQRFITVKLDQPYNISAVEFVPAGGGNGKIYDGTIWGSMDGENWTILTQSKNLTYTNAADTVEDAMANIKSFDIAEPQRVQYVKIVADRTNGNWFTARAFNFYEDTTIKNVASFSFDGTKAGTISLFDDYKNKNWKYSIDGGVTWKNVSENSHKLTQTELSKINQKSNIKIVLDGDKSEYVIKIKKGETPVKDGYLNDLENRPIGISNRSKLEWRISGQETWTSYSEKEPNVQGNKTLYVRTKATGLCIASDSIEYEFTEDNQPLTKKYIPIKHLSIAGFSNTTVPSRGEEAEYAIDGDARTMWHTNRTTTTMGDPRWIIIKLDEPKYISKLQYVKKDKYLYGILKDGIISTSMDGENWEEVVTFSNLFDATTLDELSNSDNVKDINFKASRRAQYVKLELTKSMDSLHGNRDGKPMDYFFSASMINLYEDKTKAPVVTPTAKVEYSTTKATNGDVVATLVGDNITVTNNGGKKTYTFTKNGSFTFEFVDEDGNKGTAVATVKNIDKTAPVGTVKYSVLDVTNDDVVVTLTANEDITVTNNGGKSTYTFKENGTFTFEFVDKAGNKGTATAQVSWINRNAPTASVKYSTIESTNKSVVATLTSNEDITITNNNGKNTYTFTENGTFKFEFVDKAGNKGTATAEVTWIDKTAPKGVITYSTTQPTNKSVVVTLITNEDVTITNNGGKNSYTFTKNGSFTFEFKDKAGNKGTATATVNNIVSEVAKAEVKYSTTKLTNSDVVATITGNNITVTNNAGKNTYTFTKNGSFTFEYVDGLGNKGTVVATVKNIDKVVPTAKIKYSTTQPTNKDVIATLTEYSEDITITNNNGKNTHTFTKNGVFTFEFVDKAGNKGTAKAIVNNINKVAPTAKVEYSTLKPTNKNVTATLTGLSDDITITNNNGKNTYTFTKNGTFTFEFKDKAGNVGSVVAIVENIDKTAPVANIKYSILEPTNKSVTVTLKANEDITITNNNGKSTYTFTDNGVFTFEFTDKAGNKGTAIATVNNIDKVAPTAKVKYNTTQLTNKNVVVTLADFSEDITITNNNGSNTYNFENNGTFTFEFIDKAGNKGTAIATVNNIDKVVPTAKVKYSITEPTNKDVVVTLTDFSEDITITNNNGKATKVFTKNGVFTFEFVDKAGNKGVATAIVNNIRKVAPTAKITYSTVKATNKNVVATLTNLADDIVILNNNGKNTYTFTENGTFTFEFKDKAGNIGSLVAVVNNIDKIAPTAKVTYTPGTLTNGIVYATLSDFSEKISILNNNGKDVYTFTDNGSFTFKISDEAGNISIIEAKVTWIEKKNNVNIPTDSNNSNKPTNTVDSNKQNVNKQNANKQNNSLYHIYNYNANSAVSKASKSYTVGRVTLNLTNDWAADIELKIKYLELSSIIEEKVGKDYEYFELYFEPKQGEFTDKGTMIIDLDGNKKFAGIYKVTNNKKIEKLVYKDLGDNKIEVQIDDLGEYLISYNDEKKSTEKDTIKADKDKEKVQDIEENEDDEEFNINILIIIIVLLGTSVILVLRNKEKNDFDFKDIK